MQSSSSPRPSPFKIAVLSPSFECEINALPVTVTPSRGVFRCHVVETRWYVGKVEEGLGQGMSGDWEGVKGKLTV